MLQYAVFMTVVKHLPEEIVRIFHLVIHDLSVFLDWDNLRIHKSAIRLQAQCRITVQHFLVKFRVNVDRISHDEVLAGLVIAF